MDEDDEFADEEPVEHSRLTSDEAQRIANVARNRIPLPRTAKGFAADEGA
jgi:hypothetical protein